MWFPIERETEKTLTQQVYEQIRGFILNGHLQAGEKLPSTRDLSSSLGVARIIILNVYEQLTSEGFLEVLPRQGTFVAAGSHFLNKGKYQISAEDSENLIWPHDDMIDFMAATPAMDHFPRRTWGRLAKEVCMEAPDSLFGYLPPDGLSELKEELSRYLLRTRGVVSTPRQIMITSGATQALSLITEILIKGQEYVAVEDPVTDEMRTIFSYAGASIHPIPVDEKGIQPEHLSKDYPPRFIFVLPSHQFPLGGTLSIQRRIQLIEYARKHDCYVVEDDYDSEFTYEGTPVHSVQGMDPERVIYVGTFSKILSPALRLGYVVLPQGLVEEFKMRKWYTDRHPASLDQKILARFINEGHLDRHVRKMKKIYKDRRRVLTESLKEHFPDCSILGHAAGMHLVVEFPEITFGPESMTHFQRHGVQIYPVDSYALVKGSHSHKIVMGYGGLTEERIVEGVLRIKEATKNI